MADDGALYFGSVMHRRLGKVRHRFAYRVFSTLVDLDQLAPLSARLRLFSYNRPNLLSFWDRDHGARDGSALRPWVEHHLAAAGMAAAIGGRIELLCFPRLLGFVFNPLSVFFCHGPDGRLAAILYEVANTFGERHGYLHAIPADAGAVVEHGCAKAFYVSPFIELAGSYRFRVRPPDEKLMIGIRQSAASGQTLHAVLTATRAPLDDRHILKAFFAYPLMTLKVVAAIHWEALRLWRKGAPFQTRPAPPDELVSYSDPEISRAGASQ